jgi:hypothetical protein
MGRAFNATIYAQKDYEMIWSVGLRGLNDYAYPNCITTDPGPMGCGAIISQAVGNQTKLLEAATGKNESELDFKVCAPLPLLLPTLSLLLHPLLPPSLSSLACLLRYPSCSTPACSTPFCPLSVLPLHNHGAAVAI